MAASVTSLESGGVGDVNKDDEKQNEKAREIGQITETSNKESNASSGEGDRQTAGKVRRYKESDDEGSSVDYPQIAASAEKLQVSGSGVLSNSSTEGAGVVSVTSPEVLSVESSAKGSDVVSVTSPDVLSVKPSTKGAGVVSAPSPEVLSVEPSTKASDVVSATIPEVLSVEHSTKASDVVSATIPEVLSVEPSTKASDVVSATIPEVLSVEPSTKASDVASATSPEVLSAEPSTKGSDLASVTSPEVLSAEPSTKGSDLASVTSPEVLSAEPSTKGSDLASVTSPEVLSGISTTKCSDLASSTSPNAELTVEQENTEQQTVSTLTNSKDEVKTEEIVLTTSQDVSASDSSAFATEGSLQQKSNCSENVSLIKHKLKSEISEEDSVFDDGMKTQSSDIATSDNKPSNPNTERNQPAYVPYEKVEVEAHEEERPVREMLVRRSRTESTDSNTDRPVLTFGVAKNIETIKDEETKANDMCECLLCDRSYPAYNKEDVLAHMVLMHKFVIADVNFIGIFPEYMRYWKKRFEDQPYSEFCSKIVTNAGVKDDASKEEFFLLCDALPEDKALREDLQRKKLESVLAQQQKEREETKFCRQCLFCNQTFCGNRAVLLDHLVRDHSFHVGQPDNLVFTDELFDLIQSKLDSLLCLFCEKAFKDKPSLREHMRKKQHRKINPKHKEYDRFYIVNYMEMGKNWQSLQSEDSRVDKTNEKTVNEEDEWSGWNEESASKFVCLFCDETYVTVTELLDHMKETHSFDLNELSTKLELNFYQKVKIINFIRKQVYLNVCYGCQQTFNAKDELLAHLNESPTHSQNLPDAEAWDQEIYFVPTYEDDRLLCCLEDDYDDDDDNNGDGAAGDNNLVAAVIKEDIPIPDTILLTDKKLCQDLLKT